jgi:hypothetical protein
VTKPQRYVPLSRHNGKTGEWLTRKNLETGKTYKEFREIPARMVNINGTEYWDDGGGLKRIKVIPHIQHKGKQS